MFPKHLIPTGAAALVLLAACGDRPATTSPGDPRAAGVAERATAAMRTERLARLVARAMTSPEFRTYVEAQLAASPHAERKVHFRTFLSANSGRALQIIARQTGEAEAAVAREAGAAVDLELYLPVPEHRRAWAGGEDVLVATALADGDAPIAFDPAGARRVLSSDKPPATPVLALVPVETDFSQPGVGPAAFCLMSLDPTCEPGGGGGGGTTSSATPGLYMTRSHFVKDFEGWLKGNPEFEVHILGQKGATDSLTSYQCAGGDAGGPYYFDQNNLDWSGGVLLFSKTQIDNYNATHPNQNFRVFVVEDDDKPCVIRTNVDRFKGLLESLEKHYPGLTGGNDSSTTVAKDFKRANAFQKIWAALASLIMTNDELVGNAVEDVVVGVFYAGYDWFVKAENNVTNGWIKLEMR